MRPYQNYQRTAISTADPLKILVMLYEGAIKNLHQAIRLMDQDGQAASQKIVRTLDIINYLRNALDHEKGGEISGNLERLYEYMRDTLNHANIEKNTEKINEVITLLQTLLDGWHEVAKGQQAAENSCNQTQSDTETQPDITKKYNSGLSMVG